MEFIGLTVYGKPLATDLRSAWEPFREVADEASIPKIGRDVCGLQMQHGRLPAGRELTYMACLLRERSMATPMRMISKLAPECGYAVRRVKGGVAGGDEVIG
ncbi:MAG: hypothetical protein HY812_11480 [Planctomycetes bacterium]|nr:hypothetical protein [Planctomycetota bacterium]